MARLSVNLDHIASIREVRKAKYPDPCHGAVLAEQAGADGITLHLRQDRRHISDRDLILIRQIISINLTLEMSPNDSILDLALKVKPDMVTLVPEKNTELTTERGFLLDQEGEYLEKYVDALRKAEIAVSLFIEPREDNIEIAHDLMADFIELNTTHYAEAKSFDDELASLKALEKVAHLGSNKNLAIAVGHALNYRNVGNIARIKPVEEFSIGHAIVARSIFVGLTQAVKEMKEQILVSRKKD